MGAEVRHPARSAVHLKASVRAANHPRPREQRVVRSPEQHILEVRDPALENFANVVADRNEISRERLRELRAHLPRVLLDEPGIEVHVPEAKRREGVVSRSSQERERNQGAIALFDVGLARHGQRHVPDLLNGRNRPSAFAIAVSFSESAKYSASA
jgi:hypothetical protein